MATLTKEDIVEAVGGMSLLEVADLVKMFEEKFGVSAAAPVAVAPPQAPPGTPLRPHRCAAPSPLPSCST